MLQPLVRRTWALRGCTPIIRCWDRRDRLSVIAAILVPPSRRRHELSAVFRIHPRNIRTDESLAFLRALDRHIRGPLIVVQDRLNVHKAAVRRWLATRPVDAPRVMIEWLPAYAPELNPVEQIWNHGKRGTLANAAPQDAQELRARVRRVLTHQRCRPNLLASFLDHARLTL
jgi:transposase